MKATPENPRQTQSVSPTADDKPELQGWALQNDPYTIEGELEGLGRFATGARRTRRPVMKVAAYVLIAAFLLPFGLGILSFLRMIAGH